MTDYFSVVLITFHNSPLVNTLLCLWQSLAIHGCQKCADNIVSFRGFCNKNMRLERLMGGK